VKRAAIVLWLAVVFPSAAALGNPGQEPPAVVFRAPAVTAAPTPMPTPIPIPAPTPAAGKTPFYRQYLVPGDPLDDKIVAMERRVDASPDDARLRNDFGNLLAARRFPEQAAEQYEIAMKLDKKNFISAYNLGLLRETEGKISKAISAYKKSISRKPGFPHSHFHLGLLYEHTNQPQDAVVEYAKAFWIDRSMRDPRRNPLVIDSTLIYQASLLNYRRDLAEISMHDEDVYFEESLFRRAPVDRPLSSQEAMGEEEPEEPAAPRRVGEPGAAAAPGVAAAPEGQPHRRTARPAGGDLPSNLGFGGGTRRPSSGAFQPRRVPPSGPPAKEAPPEAEAPAPPPLEAPEPGASEGMSPEALPEPTPTPGPPVEEQPS
jgi:hypothetical protein